MRRGFGLFWALVTIAIASLAGWFAYNAGLAANIANTDHGTVVIANGYQGFPFFPLVLLIIFLAFMFRRRRWYGGWGGGGWGGRGWGGHHHGPDGSHNWEVPPVIDEKLRTWHDKAHGNTPAEPTAGQPTDKPSVS
jgi:hypothetical protein